MQLAFLAVVAATIVAFIVHIVSLSECSCRATALSDNCKVHGEN